MKRRDRALHIGTEGLGRRCVLRLPDGSEHVVILTDTRYIPYHNGGDGLTVTARLPMALDAAGGVCGLDDLDEDVPPMMVGTPGDAKTGTPFTFRSVGKASA